MNRITDPIRVRALEWTLRALGHAVMMCARRLLDAGLSVPDIALTFMSEVSVEHPDTTTERLLILQTLQRPGPRSRTELEIALSDIEPLAISDALDALEAEGILYIAREQVWASGCVKHLDKLGLITI
jgi:hypothetical protein